MRRAAIAGLLAAMAFAGCATRPASHVAGPALGPLPSAAAIFDALAARRAAVRSLRAWARLSYVSPEESRRAKQLLVAERPDRLRMELLSPLGAMFVLAAADGALAAYARSESTVYRGAASAENLQRYIQVDLPIDTAVDLLLGSPPLDAELGGIVSADGSTVKLWQEDGEEISVAWFTPGLEPVRCERQDADGRVILRAAFDDYATIDGARIPTKLGIELPQTQRRIDIELSDTEINPPLPETVFALQTPAGSREVDLDQPALP